MVDSRTEKGRFITLEGGEGTGKSTQVTGLVDALSKLDIPAIKTREPGGAPGAEDIRALLVTGDVGRWEPLSEALLHYAARYDHLKKLVWPTLQAGTWVVSDRFSDSTMAYQGYGHGLERETLARLHRLVVGDFMPDLTIILDMPVEEGLSRAVARMDNEDRYERMEIKFHQRLRDGFLKIAEADPGRCVVIDATRTIAEVQAAIFAAVNDRLGMAIK